MISKGIRGAITVENNSVEEIKSATVELFSELIKQNRIEEKDVSHVIFTMTKDLDAAYPAKFVREVLGWNKTALMCFPELNIKNSLEKCIRVLVVINCSEEFEPHYVYLKGAENLRK